jgi:hypothetical protein
MKSRPSVRNWKAPKHNWKLIKNNFKVIKKFNINYNKTLSFKLKKKKLKSKLNRK